MADGDDRQATFGSDESLEIDTTPRTWIGWRPRSARTRFRSWSRTTVSRADRTQRLRRFGGPYGASRGS